MRSSFFPDTISKDRPRSPRLTPSLHITKIPWNFLWWCVERKKILRIVRNVLRKRSSNRCRTWVLDITFGRNTISSTGTYKNLYFKIYVHVPDFQKKRGIFNPTIRGSQILTDNSFIVCKYEKIHTP